jgi:glycosyltransferase involved in cell wall biosynthesis
MALSTSIVLCTFNGAKFIEAQWGSLLGQSRLPDQIVVRDDASTDATPTLLMGLTATAEARGIAVRYLRGERNLGYVANFETALKAASGDVLFLCDQDDLWHPDKLAAQVAWFERRPGLLLLCGNARRVDADGAVLPRTLFDVLRVSPRERRRIHSGDGFQVLLRRSLATGATIALRRDLLADAAPFPEGWVHDEWLAIIAAALGGFDCIETPLVDYRQHEANQIGMPERTMANKWADLRRPRKALLDTLIRRAEILDRRLSGLAGKCPPQVGEQVVRALAHWRVRRALHDKRWLRIGAVAREMSNGCYRRYGSGWRSALRDFVRRPE